MAACNLTGAQLSYVAETFDDKAPPGRMTSAVRKRPTEKRDMIMLNKRSLVVTTLLIACSYICSLAGTSADKTIEIHLSLSSRVCDRAMTGRVYVLFDRNIYGHPLDGPDGSEKKPFFAVDVTNWTTDRKLVLKNEVLGFPCALNQIPGGMYAVQALLDTNTVERNFEEAPGTIPGRIYSEIAAVAIHDSGTSVVNLNLDQIGGGHEFGETRYIREIKVASTLLTAFGGRLTTMRAAVILPPSYFEDTTGIYATVYCFPGFGTRYYSVASGDFQLNRFGMNMVGLEKVFVFLDQTTPWGCHVFANSDNNGPWASAFIEELVPYIERHFRVFPDPQSRFLTGHSSGAWAGLWLQINYPEQFGGAWAASPDPVDFSSFLGVNIYEAGANLFVTKNGDTLAMNKLLSDFDRVVGPGWQMGSIEAVFSGRADDGQPYRLWDRSTGSIDHDVAQTWKKFDIRLILEANWEVLAPSLAGKLHIYVAEDDRFGLAGPVRSLQQAMTQLNAGIDINILQKGGHDLWNDGLRRTIHQQMDELVVANHPEAAHMTVSR
jgi:S-formylglutathione hydrolase FrmB